MSNELTEILTNELPHSQMQDNYINIIYLTNAATE